MTAGTWYLRRTTLARLGYCSYDEYLNSAHWVEARRGYAASGRPLSCFVCAAKTGVQLHHRTYANLGRERLDDLVPLCDEHHRDVHDLEQNEDRDLWDAHEEVRRRYIRWFTSPSSPVLPEDDELPF